MYVCSSERYIKIGQFYQSYVQMKKGPFLLKLTVYFTRTGTTGMLGCEKQLENIHSRFPQRSYRGYESRFSTNISLYLGNNTRYGHESRRLCDVSVMSFVNSNNCGPSSSRHFSTSNNSKTVGLQDRDTIFKCSN